MKRDPLKEFVSLRTSLIKRKELLESELAQINQALAIEPVVKLPQISQALAVEPVVIIRPKAVAAVPSSSAPVKGKRAKNEMSLKEAVLAATKAKPLSKPDILLAVEKAGYVFSAKSPMSSLNTLVYSDKSFKNVDGKFGPA